MKAAILDLRSRMKDILKALEWNEEVNILHQGKLKDIITPQIPRRVIKITDHPFCNMKKGTVE